MADVSIVVEPDAYSLTITTSDVSLAIAETQGPPGRAGGNTTYPFVFAPALTWEIAHFLNRFPAVTIINTAGEVLLPSILYVDSNNILVSFGDPTSGTAYLN